MSGFDPIARRRRSKVRAVAVAVMALFAPIVSAGAPLRLLVLVSGGDPHWDFAREMAPEGIEVVYAAGDEADAFRACQDARCRAAITRKFGARAAVQGFVDVRNDFYVADLKWFDAGSMAETPMRIGSHTEAGDAPMVDALVRDWVARINGKRPPAMPAGEDATLLSQQIETLQSRVLHACTEEAVRDPGESALSQEWTLKVSLQIDPDGRLLAARSRTETTPLESCVRRELDAASFYRPMGAATVIRDVELRFDDLVLARERLAQSLIRPTPIGLPSPDLEPPRGPLPGHRIARVLATPLKGLSQGNRVFVLPASLLVWCAIALPLARRRWKRGDRAAAARILRGLGAWLLLLSIVPVVLALAWMDTRASVLFMVAILSPPLALPGAASLVLARRLRSRT